MSKIVQIQSKLEITKITADNKSKFKEISQVEEADNNKVELLEELLFLIDRSLEDVLAERCGDENQTRSIAKSKQEILEIISQLYV